MTRYRSSSRLITPPRIEDEVYPYRRVWPSIIIEVGGVFGIATLLYVLVGFIGLSIPDAIQRPVNILVALAPALLWAAASRWRERTVPEPRRGLLSVFIISALVANAIAIPILDAINPTEWLSLSPLVSRIIGNAVTFGIIHEFLKYLVVRYTVWPLGFRIRLDALAYSMAVSLGYVTMFNLNYVLNNNFAVDAVALQVFASTGLQVSAGMIVAYGLSEMNFNPRNFLLMPFTLILASFLHGVGITMRANFVNAGFFLGIAGTRPLFGLIISLVIVGAILSAIAFLFNNADRQAREAEAEQGA